MTLGSKRFHARPPAGGLTRVVERGRQLRRRRTMMATGGVGAVAALAVALGVALAGTSSTQSLQFAHPTATASGTLSSPTETEPSSAPVGGPRHASGSAADCVNNDCEERDDPPSSRAPSHVGRQRPSYTERPTSSFETRTTCVDGTDQEVVSDGATCVMSDSPREVTVRRGQILSMPMRLCVASNAKGPVSYHFPTGGEHDVLVYDDHRGGVVWSFASSVTFTGEAHDVRLLPRECRGYTTNWNLRDASGRPVPVGDYTVNLRSLASTRGGHDWPDDQKGLPFFRLHVTA